MSDRDLRDQVWRSMATMVFDNRDSWRRAVVGRTGLPFSRVRVLRRLARRPMTATQIASAATMDAPATTVALNELEQRGLIVREADPNNRRSKVISLTDAGRDVVAHIDDVDDPAPKPFAALSESDLLALQRILGQLQVG